MNPLFELKKTAPLLLIALTLHCFALLPQAPAVVPPPDGGYPNFNTAEGTKALFSLTTGQGNTAVGWFTLESLATGNFNTAIGAAALVLNTGAENTATGTAALFLNTTGFQNTANGAFALLHNTEGSDNTATGFQALFNNTTGANNTAVGVNALGDNTTGSGNTAIGTLALLFNDTGGSNTATGAGALFSNSTGENNTANGSLALSGNTIGNFNTANGKGALQNNTEGDRNTAHGEGALLNNTTGSANTAIGRNALDHNISGVSNIALGEQAGTNVTTADDVICIGSFGDNVSHGCYIRNIFGQTSASGTPVFVNNSNKLGTSTSSKRFKEEIKPMDQASEALFALKPVAFRYKKEIDSQRISQFGLVAEDVDAVAPDLVVRDKEGKPYSVRYDQVNSMLLNEFLKEHRKNEEQQAVIVQLKSTDAKQEAIIAKQQKQIEALTSGLQKVSDQLAAASPSRGGLELSKFATGRIRSGGPAPEVAVNNP